MGVSAALAVRADRPMIKAKTRVKRGIECCRFLGKTKHRASNFGTLIHANLFNLKVRLIGDPKQSCTSGFWLEHRSGDSFPALEISADQRSQKARRIHVLYASRNTCIVCRTR